MKIDWLMYILLFFVKNHYPGKVTLAGRSSSAFIIDLPKQGQECVHLSLIEGEFNNSYSITSSAAAPGTPKVRIIVANTKRKKYSAYMKFLSKIR